MVGVIGRLVLGIVFFTTADPTYNTTAPPGPLAGSGWQWVGLWGAYTGTPIAPSYFLTARHVGGNVGDSFYFNGVAYTTTAFYDDTVSDLRIWQVSGQFPTWAPLYGGSSEVGSPLVVFGRGVPRGDPVSANGNLCGWQWSNYDGILRWGQNTIVSVVDGGSYWGQLLYALFTGQGGPNECDLADADSTSPVFIQVGSQWELAGIGAAVDGPFSTTASGPGFDASIFDARGLYIEDETDQWELVTGSSAVPTGFYATQVSVRMSWINSIVPPVTTCDSPLFSPAEMAGLALGLLVAGLWSTRRMGRRSAG